MKIVITGGGGFIGQMFACALIARGGLAAAPGAKRNLTRLVLLDQAFPSVRIEDERVHYETGDVGNAELLERAFAANVDAVFHLAAVVSAGAEADFDLGMRVNLDAARQVLEACRLQPVPPRLVFTSSVAAFGGDLPDVVSDATAATPMTRKLSTRRRTTSRRNAIGERCILALITRRVPLFTWVAASFHPHPALPSKGRVCCVFSESQY